jgi:hypothetical protein
MSSERGMTSAPPEGYTTVRGWWLMRGYFRCGRAGGEVGLSTVRCAYSGTIIWGHDPDEGSRLPVEAHASLTVLATQLQFRRGSTALRSQPALGSLHGRDNQTGGRRDLELDHAESGISDLDGLLEQIGSQGWQSAAMAFQRPSRGPEQCLLSTSPAGPHRQGFFLPKRKRPQIRTLGPRTANLAFYLAAEGAAEPEANE